MKFDANIFELNQYRYPRSDLFVIMTVEQGLIKYLSTEDGREGKFKPDSESALVFDGFNLASKVHDDMQLGDSGHHYIVPLAAIQILTGVCGGVTPTHTVVSLERQ